MQIQRLRAGLGASIFAVAGVSLLPSAAAQAVSGETYGFDVGKLFGAAVACAGDVDKDGVQDFVVAEGGSDSAIHLVSGRHDLIVRTHTRAANEWWLGVDVTGGADVNGDGYPDYAAGASGTDVGAKLGTGMARVYSGKDGSVLWSAYGPHQWQNFGYRLEFIGDTNGDGVSDLAVASHVSWIDPVFGGNGRVDILSGTSGSILRTFVGTHGKRLGVSVAAVGDWDGDGRADVAVGGMEAWVTKRDFVCVASGATGAVLATIESPDTWDYFGQTIAALPDMDGDGRSELVVGAPKANGIGAVHVVASATLQPSLTLNGQAPGANFGYAVCAVGDVDGDGRSDFAATSPYGGAEAMRVHSAVDGKTLWAPLMKALPLSSPTITTPNLGAAIASLGDMDGDGWKDVVVTAPSATFDGHELGAALVVRLAHHQPVVGYDGPGNSALSVYGTPLGLGGHADLEVKFAGVHRPGVLVVSPWQQPTPILGGTLLPTIDGLLIHYATDADGRYVLKGIPGGLGLFSVYAQAVTANPALPQGFGFSNAVRIDFQP